MVFHWRTARDVSISQDGYACCYLAEVSESKRRASDRVRRCVVVDFMWSCRIIILKVFVRLVTVEHLE
jgi:hypothetical protein